MQNQLNGSRGSQVLGWLLGTLLGSPLLAQQVAVYDGRTFQRVDEERLRTLTIREWQIRCYWTAEDQSANRSWGTITGSSAEECSEKLAKRRAEHERYLRFGNLRDDGKGGGYRFVSKPYAVVDRGALTSASDSARGEQQRLLAEQQRAQEQQRQAQAEAQQRALERANELRRQAEQASRDRQARTLEAQQKAAASQQANEQARILNNTVAKLERMQAQANAINQAFQQIGELLQAQFERDRIAEEARQAREEEREARREAQRLEQQESQLRQQAEEAARAQAAAPAEPAPDAVQPSPAAVSPGLPLPDAPEGSASSSGNRTNPAVEARPAEPAPSRPSFAGLLHDPAPPRRDDSAQALSGLLGAVGVTEQGIVGRVIGDTSPTAKQAVEDAHAIRRVLGDGQLAKDTAKELAGDASAPTSGPSVLDRLYQRYAGIRDGRVLGENAGLAGRGRSLEGQLDQLQQRYQDRIPETVRIETDAWRMLFARGASGDLAGHAKGHVDFAQRWVFDRMDLPPPASATTGSGGRLSSVPSRPVTPTRVYEEREALITARSEATSAVAAPDMSSRARHLRRLLDATDVLPDQPAARRDALYLRAAAALDLADPEACRRARFDLQLYRADQTPTEQERELLRLLDQGVR